MPMSEWSSDVCSSDPAECRTCTRPIDRLGVGDRHVALTIAGRNQGELWRRRDLCPGKECLQSRIRHIGGKPQALQAGAIGREAWRESVGKYVEISGVDVS